MIHNSCAISFSGWAMMRGIACNFTQHAAHVLQGLFCVGFYQTNTELNTNTELKPQLHNVS